MATIIGTEGDDELIGGDEDDLIQGLGGQDVLDGAGGANTLEGGTGGDEYHVHSLADVVIEEPGDDFDVVFWDGAGLYTLAANVEALFLDEGATEANGNELDNFMFANIYVGGVNVTMDGGAGNDDMWGGANDDFLFGGDGNDSIDGGGGGDTIHGGGGDDYLSGESFSFGDGWNDTLFGDDGDDLLDGLDGDDVLNGGDGSDTMLGYGGLDTMNGGAGADFFEMILSGYSDGEDTIEDFTNGEDVILLALDGLTRPSMDDVTSITQDGNDTLITFSAGGPMRLLDTEASTITVDDFFFYQDGDSTDDELQGGKVRDRLSGEDGNDRLSGGRGADELIGGRGHDMLDGGKGADVFRYTSLHDSGDRISDFHARRGDVIDLSAIDANTAKAGNQAFHFVDAFGGHRAEATLTYDAVHKTTILRLDADGDAHTDFKLTLDGHVSQDAGWIL